jgi:hypothetical protein
MAKADEGKKRTTVVLSEEDCRALESVAAGLKTTSEMEAIRRSLRVMARLLELQADEPLIIKRSKDLDIQLVLL